MDYDEPEPLPFAARHWLGPALIEAEAEYRVELKDHPHDIWSLYGLNPHLRPRAKLMRILPSARPVWTSGLQRHEYKPVSWVTGPV